MTQLSPIQRAVVLVGMALCIVPFEVASGVMLELGWAGAELLRFGCVVLWAYVWAHVAQHWVLAMGAWWDR